MRSFPTVCVLLVLALAFQTPAVAQDRGISGKWSGTSINSSGKSDGFLEVTENEDGTLTGKWGSTGNELKIDKGERVTADILRWESSTETHRWCVQAKVNGKSLVLEYTCTWKADGKIQGAIGTAVLTRD